MSKEAAMQLATGTTQETVNPSVVVGPMDAPAPEIPAPAEERPLDSDRYAKLAAREAKIVKERSELAAERQKMADLKKMVDDFEALKKTDPVKAFEQLGFTQTDFVNFVAEKNTEKTPEQKAAEAAQAEIQKLRDEMTAKEKAAAADRDERALGVFKEQIGKSVQAEAEKYEYCAFNGEIANEIIFETVLGFIKEDPTLTPQQAMKEAIEAVESFYEEEDKEMSTKIKKRQTAAAPVKEEPLKPQVNPRTVPTQRNRVLSGQEVVKKQIPTLSQKATATAASAATKVETPSHKRERLAERLRNGG